MSWFKKVIALALLALWVPATMHCDLAAAGMLSAHAAHHENTCANESHPPSPSDNCQVIEDGSYKPSHVAVKASSPSLLLCVFSLCRQPTALAALRESVPPSAAIETALSWIPTRHFVRGAAPLSRAPSVVLV